MLKETETEETIVFFVTFFLSLVAFQFGEPGLPPPGYASEIVNQPIQNVIIGEEMACWVPK